MEFLLTHWYLIVVAVAVLAVAIYSFYVFFKMPTTGQLNQVREWLLFAVTEAEKVLGSGTGQVKLRYVYDMFISRFPHLAKAVSFEAFSFLVDEALDKFRVLLEQNNNLQNYVNGVPTIEIKKEGE